MPDPAPYPPPSPLTAPPSWLLLLGKGEDGDGPGAPGPEHEGPFPGPHWPDLHTVEYLSKLIILIVLLLALPWLVGKLLTDPGEVLSHAAAPSVAANSMGA